MRLWPQPPRARRAARRTDAEWVAAVTSADAEALEDLRALLVRALGPTLRRLAPTHAAELAQDTAQDALVKITAGVHTYRAEARFTTWATKVAVRLAYTELRRLRWRDVSLDDLLERAPEGAAAPSETPTPDAVLEESDGVRLVRALIAEALTERQRTALEAVMRGMELEEVAARMGTNRNALYKLLHDARQRLKRALDARGLRPDDLFPDDA